MPCFVVLCGACDCTKDTRQRCSLRYRSLCLVAPPDAPPCISGTLPAWLVGRNRLQTAEGQPPTSEVGNKSRDSFALRTRFGAIFEVFLGSWELTWFNKQIPGDGLHVSRAPSGNRIGYEEAYAYSGQGLQALSCLILPPYGSNFPIEEISPSTVESR